ncbi:MAG: hypothetical protein H0T88_01595 [Lysobacter sp.]|nr:hypothetical protein [Lysobacter sp.]
MNLLQMIRVASAALLMSSLCNVGHAQQQRVVLMLDTSMEQVSGARLRLGFERLPADDEKAIWADPDGPWDSAAIALAAGGGVLGVGLGDVHAQAERHASIKVLRDALAQSDGLKEIFEHELGRSMGASGYQAHRTIHARRLDSGHAARGLVEPEDAMAIAVQKDGLSQIVNLSWDDRQPLLAIDLRTYARRDGDRGVTAREKARSVVRYVGYQAPTGQDPRAYWAADGAKAFTTEVQAGLQRMTPVLWDETLKVPKVPRKETVTVDVAGAPQVFPGRLWKQEEGAAYLFNKDGGITIVATAGPPVQ